MSKKYNGRMRLGNCYECGEENVIVTPEGLCCGCDYSDDWLYSEYEDEPYEEKIRYKKGSRE